jgi:hypothetical protein
MTHQIAAGLLHQSRPETKEIRDSRPFAGLLPRSQTIAIAWALTTKLSTGASRLAGPYQKRYLNQ